MICFRADASTTIGSGHVMRCLTLATELKAADCSIVFMCRDLPGHLGALIQNHDFEVVLLPTQEEDFVWQQDRDAVIQAIANCGLLPDWLIVDNYALNWNWEEAVRPYCKKIMVIDDLANRRHNCDLLLDQNYYSNMSGRYSNLMPENCRLLLGPQYALLRSEFIVARKNLRVRSGSIKRMLVFFGGSDPTNETLKALQSIELLQLSNVAIDVVVGLSNPNHQAIREKCQQIPACSFHCQVKNMAELMAQADLAIGAGGTASWERCYLGLPTIGVIVADNQDQLVADLVKLGALISVGKSKTVTVEILAAAIWRIFQDSQLRENLSRRSLELMSGHGVGTVIATLMEDSNV